jgi:uncharacterized protein
VTSSGPAASPGVPALAHPLYGPFWGECPDGFLNLPRCRDCDYLLWPPAGVCPECLGTRIEWTTAPGIGTVWSVAMYEFGFTRELAGRVPYACVLVELDAGPRLVSALVGMAPERITPGLRVTATRTANAAGVRLPCFRPIAVCGPAGNAMPEAATGAGE